MLKTMVLELLQQRPELYDQLRSKRMLMPSLDHYSSSLKTRHEAWKVHLAQAKAGSDESQIASEALEFALKELEDSLPPASPPDEHNPLSLEGAMAFLRRTPPA